MAEILEDYQYLEPEYVTASLAYDKRYINKGLHNENHRKSYQQQ